MKMGDTMRWVTSLYQSENPEINEFNEELINFRVHDKIDKYLEDIFIALEVLPGLKYHGLKIIADESKFPQSLYSTEIEITRTELAVATFSVDIEGEAKFIDLAILIPKFINNLSFMLNGNTYFPILQLLDKGCYNTKKTLTLKTLLMPLTFRRDAYCKLIDITKNELVENVITFNLDLFKKCTNIFKYYYPSFGLNGVLEFFGLAEHVEFIELDSKYTKKATKKTEKTLTDYLEYADDYVIMKNAVGNSNLGVICPRSWYNESDSNRRYFVTLVDSLNGVNYEDIFSDDLDEEKLYNYWMIRLGSVFTQNISTAFDKAEKTVISFNRILDRRTKINLVHVDDYYKQDIYHICKWMMDFFDEHNKIDPMSVYNKRIRVSEYLVHALQYKFSNTTFRVLNNRGASPEKILDLLKNFKLKEEGSMSCHTPYIIRALMKSDLLRFQGQPNDFDLLIALRWTIRGPQSIGSTRWKGEVNTRLRGLDPSYIGVIGLTSASSSDPGTTGTLVPFVKTDGNFFKPPTI